MRLSGIIYSILFLAFLVACRQNGQTIDMGEVSTDSLKVQLTTLTDSLSVTWKEMTESDDQKILEMERLLMSIQEKCQVSGNELAKLKQEQQVLADRRYKSPEEMSSEHIDAYDAATDSLLQGIDALYEAHQVAGCCSTCENLREDIKRRHSDVVMYRIRYDSHAREYNALVTQQKDNLKRINSAYGDLKPRQLFSLMQ